MRHASLKRVAVGAVITFAAVLGPVVLTTAAAHASGEAACVGVLLGPGTVGPIVAKPGPCTAAGIVEVNVCTLGGGTLPPALAVGVRVGNTSVWGNLLKGPLGQLEVLGKGIASEQTGC